MSDAAQQPDTTPGEAVPTVSFDEFRKLDLRVAEVEQVVPHPNADKLLLLTVRVGEATKQVVAGIKAYRQPDDLVGKQIIIVNNLEPATLRGERSEGMLLAVVAGDQFALVSPDARVAHGARVS